MKTQFQFLLSAVMLISLSTLLKAQYTTSTFVDELKNVVNMDQFHDPFSFVIKYAEAPHPVGKKAERRFLHTQKLAAQKFTPLSDAPSTFERGALLPPEILHSFGGNNIITGTPLDNHLAVGGDETIISTINTHMLVTNTTGFFLGSYKLDLFYQSVGTGNRYFDPRVIYDPDHDRFIMVLINGSECFESKLVLAFSQTNNPKGNWNLYAIDGCIDDDGTFADYPMIAITDTEFFLTYNEVHSDSTWQAGFMGTQIHQINKLNGYNGEALQRKVWRDVTFNGRLLRNIVPVRNADESLASDLYLLSDRNFDISNDTVFLLHLTGKQDDPNATLTIDYKVLNIPYGVPPYAVQTRDSMDTNDARILDAFLLNGTIQYVNNTMDFNTGRSAVFHGVIHLPNLQNVATGYVISHPTDYLGYPGIAWTGSDPSQSDAIIVMSHTSPTRHPGGSAIYTDGFGQYSDFVTIIEGTKPVDMLTGKVERWGDYAGIQRLYHQPGSVWVANSYGKSGNVNEAWIAKLARQEENVGVKDNFGKTKVTAFPNPSFDYVTIEVDNPDGKKITVALFDAAGIPVRQLFDSAPAYKGKATMTFSTVSLPSGHYIVRVMLDDKLVNTKNIVRQ